MHVQIWAYFVWFSQTFTVKQFYLLPLPNKIQETGWNTTNHANLIQSNDLRDYTKSSMCKKRKLLTNFVGPPPP